MRLLRYAPVALAALGALLLLEGRSLLFGCAPAPRRAAAPPPPLPTPPAACPPPRSRFLLDRTALPRGLPGEHDEPLHLTFATASVDELLTNWAAHVRRLRMPAVVAAMDRAVVARCPALRVHCLASLDEQAEETMRREALRNGHRDATTINIRGNPTLFISLGARKVESILTLLHVSGRPVLVSDVDVVWLHDPARLVRGALRGYEDFAHADVLGSTDCLDAERDVLDHGCFHVLQVRPRCPPPPRFPPRPPTRAATRTHARARGSRADGTAWPRARALPRPARARRPTRPFVRRRVCVGARARGLAWGAGPQHRGTPRAQHERRARGDDRVARAHGGRLRGVGDRPDGL
jgi:hypothetical protein